MICLVPGCEEKLWRQTRPEVHAAAGEAGWRWCNDGKAPALSVGVAICPAHVAAGEATNFQPAKKRSAK